MSTSQIVRRRRSFHEDESANGTDVASHTAIETLLADLLQQEASAVHRRTRRTARYRMLIDGPFIETKEFGGSATDGSREP